MTRRPLLEVENFQCPICGESDVVVDYERGQIVCRNCGVVLRENVADLGPEWRKPEASRAYSGPLGSSLGNVERGIVKMTDRLKAISMRKFSRHISTPIERVETSLRQFLEAARVKLNIPKPLIDDTVMIYKKLYSAGYRSTRPEAFAAVLLYSLKNSHTPTVSAKKLAGELGLSKHLVDSEYMKVLSTAQDLGMKIPRIDPKFYIPKIVSSLGVRDEKSAKIQKIALDILRYISSIPKVRNGRKPQILAAVAVYYACYIAGVEVTQKDVARAAESTEGPVRELLRDLEKSLHIEITV